LRYNAKQELTEETFIEADFGHYLQISDLVEGGKPYVYTITPVTADGRFGQTSEPVGIISSTEPLRPILHLSFSDNSMLHGLARLADNALALGGRGWAELPPQPEWNPEHALTLALWVKLENLNGSPVLICKGKWQEAGYFLQALNNKFRFYMAGVDTLDAGIPQTGKWQHVAATYGFGEMRIFVNGELVGRKYVSGRPKPSKDPLLIGRYGANDSIYFVHGMMDDIRIYVAPMTQGEIKTLCNETKNDRNP
jgi:hypothetical protein